MPKDKKRKRSEEAMADQQTVTAQEATEAEKPKKYERKVPVEIGAALAAYLLFRYIDFKAEWNGNGKFLFRVAKKDMDALDEQVDRMERQSSTD